MGSEFTEGEEDWEKEDEEWSYVILISLGHQVKALLNQATFSWFEDLDL